MRKSALELMAPATAVKPAHKQDVAHYIDPHVWWHDGETVIFGEPNSVGPKQSDKRRETEAAG